MKIEALQALLRQSETLDGALLVSPENRRYFTEFPASDGFLLVGGERAVFVTDSRYLEAAKAEAKDCEVVLQSTDAGQLRTLFSEMGVRRIGVEASRMSLSEFGRYAQALLPLELVADDTLDTLLFALRRTGAGVTGRWRTFVYFNRNSFAGVPVFLCYWTYPERL